MPTLLAALTACTPSPTPSTDEAASSRPASQNDVVGVWDVVSFDGYTVPFRSIGTDPATFVRFDEFGVGLRLECNTSGVPGRVRDGRFVPQDEGPRITTLAGCGTEKNERESRFFAFFDATPSVEMLPDRRLRLTANGSEAILQRPEERHLDYVPALADLQGQWRMEFLSMYIPEGGMSGMGLNEVPGRIVFEGSRAGYSRCPAYDISFDYQTDGTISKRGGASLPEEPVACEDLAERSYRNQSPERWDVLTLLHGNPQAEWLANGELLLFNETFGMKLTQQPCVVLNQSDDHSETWEEDCASPE